MREHSPLTRKRARRAAGTRGSRAEELADVTFVLPDDLLLLLVRSPAPQPCPSPALAATLTSPIVTARATRPFHAAAGAAFTTPPTSPPQLTHRRVVARCGSAETALSMEAVR